MVETEDRLYCFINMERPCTAECMAYQLTPKEESPYLDGVQQHCTVLQSLEKTGRGAVVVAGVLRKDSQERHIKDADAQREAATLKPKVPGVT